MLIKLKSGILKKKLNYIKAKALIKQLHKS